MTCKIFGAWVVIRTCPFDGTESILGVFPEGKAALLKLEWFMDDPSDNEEYKLEFHMFRSYEQELEAIQRCKANRAEWDEKSRIYENYKQEKEESKMDSEELVKLQEEEDKEYAEIAALD
jgi:hypothetical protein